MEPVKKKKNKGGRPPKPERKAIIIPVRFDKSEHYIIRQKAQKAGSALSRYIREAAIHGQIKARMTEEERNLSRQMVGMANNLNQLVKGFNEAGMLKTAKHFEEYRNKIDDLLNKVRDDK